MLAWSVLALCAFGVVSGTTASTATTKNRDRRSTFLDIVRDRPSSASSYKFPVLPVELPIQLGGHGGVNLPVLVLPVPVPVYTKLDSCEAHQTKPGPVENDSPNFIIPPTRKPMISLDGYLNDNPSPVVVIPEPPTPRDPGRQPPRLETTDPPPTTEPVSNYVTGSLYPDPGPPRRTPNRPPAKLVTTDPPPTTEPVSNYVTGSLYPDPGPPRRTPNRPPAKLVTTDPPPTTEPVSNYVTGSLYPDPGPPRRTPNRPPAKLVTTDPPPTTEPVSNYVTGSLYPDPGAPRRPPNRPPPKLVTIDPPPTTKPVSNYVTGSLYPDPGAPRRPPNRPPPKLITTDPPPTSEPARVEDLEHVVEQGQIPYSEGRGQIFATTAELIQSFRKETPEAPELPAVIPRGRRFPDRIPPTEPDAPPEATIFAPSPPRPDFGRSLRLQIDLTVPRSDFTEVYDIDWHAESNTACTEVEDGATIIYRVPLLDGRVQFLKIQEDRLNGTAVRRCTMSPLLPATPADKTFPGLPDLSLFHFVGYTAAEGWSLVERWSHTVIGKPGEGGAAPGESLNFSHDFFMYRDGGHAMPLKYSVVTHSSVLGPACDSYTHRYRLLPQPTSPSLPDMSQCDVTEELKEERRQRRDLGDLVSGAFSAVSDFFNPIGDFLGPTRHPKYDSLFDNYKDKFRRNYRDIEEEAVRKQEFIKTNRFVEAANRIAVTFGIHANAFADRVQEELNFLFGAVPPPPGVAPPPGSAPEFDFGTAKHITMHKDFPKSFDWRIDRSFETPVRDQGTKCMSCWAFAVAGATEGAFFNKTNKIVPLSPQTLVDCGDASKYNCDGGWPVDAFGYVKDNGLPSWEEYMYEAKEQQCKSSSVPIVTHISEYHTVSPSEEALKVAIYTRAPTVVVVKANVNSFKYFDGNGVLDDTKCSKKNHDHAVLAVGWDTIDSKSNFIIKNSWGTTWAKGGYGNVESGHCGIKDYGSYPKV